MSNNEMRSRTIFDRDGETKVTISVAGDSRFASSIPVSRRRALLRSSIMRYGDDGGLPKLCDSFSGDMAMVAAVMARQPTISWKVIVACHSGGFGEEIGASARSQNHDREALTKKLLEKNSSPEKTMTSASWRKQACAGWPVTLSRCQ
ncbi:hypothetical protein TIFTF001_017002 [Ficus carica]|uniref:Uncharacterized protein n=1 Tax=Ficus carica TaxID=3494 RepID=A0AA88A9T2_FICCA|nr:hypothetical protein TIFTF001_017002 [Ficus carica]